MTEVLIDDAWELLSPWWSLRGQSTIKKEIMIRLIKNVGAFIQYTDGWLQQSVQHYNWSFLCLCASLYYSCINTESSPTIEEMQEWAKADIGRLRGIKSLFFPQIIHTCQAQAFFFCSLRWT